ncbi:MAG: hypothetical protein HQL31_02705 [Planctomycetes bacterium]|nr:hypothetical protein [Planctomycetota bacterium]
MLKSVVKRLLAGTAIKRLDDYRQLSIQLLKIEVARRYLHGVRLARRSALGLLQLGLVLGFIAIGALLMHAGLFILLPGSLETKALLGVALGAIYVLIGTVVLGAGMKEKTWMEQSGATTMLKDATGQSLKE